MNHSQYMNDADLTDADDRQFAILRTFATEKNHSAKDKVRPKGRAAN